jgi:hypothetical protein
VGDWAEVDWGEIMDGKAKREEAGEGEQKQIRQGVRRRGGGGGGGSGAMTHRKGAVGVREGGYFSDGAGAERERKTRRTLSRGGYGVWPEKELLWEGEKGRLIRTRF